jgi:co-chaperonin GroES (HSP10)
VTLEIESVQPTRDLCWIKPDRRVLQRESGVVIPQWSDGKDWPEQMGWVFATGPEVTEVRPGDYVIWEIYAGPLFRYRKHDPTVEDEEYVVVCERDIVAIYEPESLFHDEA